MAAWQVELRIVPRHALLSRDAPRASVHGDTHAWTSHTLPADYQRRLGAMTTTASSATTERQTWGDAEGNRIEITFEGGRVREVKARVDVRRLDAKFGASLIQFARTANAVFVRSDGLIVEPQIAAYAAALRSSEAWKYNKDALSSLALRDDDDER